MDEPEVLTGSMRRPGSAWCTCSLGDCHTWTEIDGGTEAEARRLALIQWPAALARHRRGDDPFAFDVCSGRADTVGGATRAY